MPPTGNAGSTEFTGKHCNVLVRVAGESTSNAIPVEAAVAYATKTKKNFLINNKLCKLHNFQRQMFQII